MHQYGKIFNITDCYAIMEKPLLTNLTRTFFPFEIIGPEFDCYGPVLSCLLKLADINEQVFDFVPDSQTRFASDSYIVSRKSYGELDPASVLSSKVPEKYR